MQRIGGTVHKLTGHSGKGYGIVIGDDGVHYLLLPSAMQLPTGFIPPRVEREVGFDDIVVGSYLKFFPFKHPRGWRANVVTVAESPVASVPHGHT